MSSLNKKMIGQSSAMQRVNYLIQRVAQSDVDCLILGETGTGKELAARKIHDSSWRKKEAFIPVNCSALSENLFESELFGHVKGAFTGAIGNKQGRFELAHNGTIFLDEIGELSPSMQVKLLRTLQERQIEKVGSAKILDINVRVIAATNRNLRTMIKEGTFREDFYYRINIFSILLPSLKQRKDDISFLIDHFLKLYTTNDIKIDSKVKNILENYSWPGNIRQLENCIRHSLVLATKTIYPMHLPHDIIDELNIDYSHFEENPQSESEQNNQNTHVPSQKGKHNNPENLSSEKEQLISALKEANGNRSRAAQILNVSRVTVWHRMKKYNLLPRQNEIY